MLTAITPALTLFMLLWVAAPSTQAQQRLVLIDQDGSGPADSNQMSMMALLKMFVELMSASPPRRVPVKR